ncbi:MAG: glutathione S-transferase family protein [Paracoccaceae bacterium]
MDDLRLTGYGPSVYTRAVRVALHDLKQPYSWADADPFDPQGREVLRERHPFARVPVLEHGDAVIYETRAILTYLDVALRPGGKSGALHAARVAQVQGVADAYGYWPMVRQVYSHGAFRPAMGEAHDGGQVEEGLKASGAVLDALERIAVEGIVLNGREVGPADWHLAPMIDAFRQVEAGAAMLADRPALASWFAVVSARESMRSTEHRLEGGPA